MSFYSESCFEINFQFRFHGKFIPIGFRSSPGKFNKFHASHLRGTFFFVQFRFFFVHEKHKISRFYIATFFSALLSTFHIFSTTTSYILSMCVILNNEQEPSSDTVVIKWWFSTLHGSDYLSCNSVILKYFMKCGKSYTRVMKSFLVLLSLIF